MADSSASPSSPDGGVQPIARAASTASDRSSVQLRRVRQISGGSQADLIDVMVTNTAQRIDSGGTTASHPLSASAVTAQQIQDGVQVLATSGVRRRTLRSRGIVTKAKQPTTGWIGQAVAKRAVRNRLPLTPLNRVAPSFPTPRMMVTPKAISPSSAPPRLRTAGVDAAASPSAASQRGTRVLSDDGDAPIGQSVTGWTAVQLGQFIERTVASATARALQQALSPAASVRRTPPTPQTPRTPTPRALSVSAVHTPKAPSPLQSQLPQAPEVQQHGGNNGDNIDNIQDVTDTDSLSSASSPGLLPMPLPVQATSTTRAMATPRATPKRSPKTLSGNEEEQVEEAVRMDVGTSARSANLATWSVADLQTFLQQQIREGKVKIEERPSLEQLFDPDKEIQAPYVEELRERALMLPRLANTFSATPTSEKQDSDEEARQPVTWHEAVMMASQNKVVKALMGKWQTPTHFGPLLAETLDFDWWFREMHLHLDACCITRQEYWMHFYRLHCNPEFWTSIRERLRSEGIAPYKILHHPHKFQEYVCLRYTRPTYADEVRQRIFDLNKRKLPTSEAWREISKLVFCYNEFMRRTKGTPFTAAQHSAYFINTLHENLFQHLNQLLLQQHPSVRTPNDTHLAALAFERSQSVRAGMLGTVVPDAVMTAPPAIAATAAATTTTSTASSQSTTTTANARGRRGGKMGKRAMRREQQKQGEAVNQATVAVATTQQVPPPPPPPANIATPPPPTTDRIATSQQVFAAAQQPHCPRCGGNHFLANRPTHAQQAATPQKQQQHRHQHRPASQYSRRQQTRMRCNYCGRDNHMEDRCWLKFPNLRPPKFFAAFFTATIWT